MKRIRSSGSLRWIALSIIFLVPGVSAFSFTSRDADSAFDAYNRAFYVVSNGFGFYKKDTSGGRSDFWMQAEEIEMILDACERTNSPAHRRMIVESINGFTNHFSPDWTRNKFNDDIIWMTIACARGYLATGNSGFRDLAKHHFDAVYRRAWDMELGGGLYWSTDNASKNACINGPAAIAACYLYEICGDSNYLAKAKAIYAWERSTLFDSTNGAVCDNIRWNGALRPKVFTYNQGTFIGAANYLHKLTGDAGYYNDALLAANYTKNTLSGGGNLPAYGSSDPGGFNGIFMRWMARFVKENKLWPAFYDWMSSNANAAWNVRRADNLSWQNWNSATPRGMLDSWDCSDAVVILQVVPPAQPRP
jgi:predicted alpha-1,6-mannanase (GH76 family)